MKRIIIVSIIVSVVLTLLIINKKIIKKEEEIRAIYFSYIEFQNYIEGKNEEESKSNIREVLDNIDSLDFNRIIVHTRAFSDSIYKSKYYPISKYVLNDKNEYPNYDVLEFFISEAHRRNINFEAWINPYRISNSKEDLDNPVYKKYSKSKSASVTQKGLYLNPASNDVKVLIINGIKEIIEKYDVDGIHFDDYFYPDKEIDLKTYEEYSKYNPSISIDDYRMNNVKELIKNVYKTIKSINKEVVFGIAPEGNINNCYENSYLDIKKILDSNEYIDYIMPQIYFGFDNETRPFINTINEWNNLIKNKSIKLIPALAFYKVGTYDKYALSGSHEWEEYSNIIGREIEYARKVKTYKGFSLFSYNYLFNDRYKNNKSIEEMNNMINILEKK